MLTCRLYKSPLSSEQWRQKPDSTVGGIQVRNYKWLDQEGGVHFSRGVLATSWIDFLMAGFPDPHPSWTDLEHPPSAFPVQTHPAYSGQEHSLGAQTEGRCGCEFQGNLPPATWWYEQVITASPHPKASSCFIHSPTSSPLILHSYFYMKALRAKNRMCNWRKERR